MKDKENKDELEKDKKQKPKDEHCGHGCSHDHHHEKDDDEVEIHGFKDSKEFQKYQQAFLQLENALVKADGELTEYKKKAEEYEHLAVSYKKDLERFKERSKNQEEEFKQKAIENVADQLIPILDNFEQALKVGGDKNTIKGFEMIEGMLKGAIKSLGITEIEALGEQFDPELHNAVSKRKTSDKKKVNTVAAVYQKGYRIGESGRIVRHAMVEIYLED